MAINQKPLPALREGVQVMASLAFSLRPLSSAGRVGEAPLDHRMMMVVVPAETGNVHMLSATLQTPLRIVNRIRHASIPRGADVSSAHARRQPRCR
ncbi:MAG TPA: hypothetical protein VF381_11400, partial [Thermoanaerobaculia bacterium]